MKALTKSQQECIQALEGHCTVPGFLECDIKVHESGPVGARVSIRRRYKNGEWSKPLWYWINRYGGWQGIFSREGDRHERVS